MNIIKRKRDYNYSTAVALGFKCGAVNEQNGEYGIAHLTEHMLFKGTKKYSIKDIGKEVERRGGDINAITNHDYTIYKIEIPHEHTNFAKEFLLELVNNSTIPEEELEREKEVVCEEIRACEDSPIHIAYDFFLHERFFNTPYGRTITGTEESVRNITSEQIKNWASNHYISDNAVLSIVGETNINENFEWNNKGTDGCYPIITCPQVLGRIAKYKKDLKQAIVYASFPLFPSAHPDYFKTKLFATILGSGFSSILFQKVRVEKGLVYSIGSEVSCNSALGYSLIDFACDPSKIDEILSIVTQEIEKIQKQGISEDELELFKGFLIGCICRGIDDNWIYAKQLICNYFDGFPSKLDVFKSEINKITVEDIQYVAKEYFNDKSRLITELLPETCEKN